MRAALQIDAFAGGVVGDEDAHFRVVVEGGDVGAANVARDAAVNDRDSFGLAEHLSNLIREIEKSVARLGENDELAPSPRRLVDHRWFVEDFGELPPFR